MIKTERIGRPIKQENQKLSFEEMKRFTACKKIITEGLQSCFEVGAAFIEIRDSQLYRETFDTFEEFCRNTYRIGSRRAEQLMVASEVKESVSNAQPVANQQKDANNCSHVENPASLLTNENQARELAKVAPENRVEVLQKAATNGTVSARAIRTAAAETPTPKGGLFAESQRAKQSAPVEMEPSKMLDKVGRVIPTKIEEIWVRSTEEAKSCLDALSKLRCLLKTKQEEDDVAFREMNHSSTISDLNSAYCDFQRLMPYAVCYSCQGLRPEKCTACKGRGFTSKHFWDICVPVEFKTLISKK